MITAKYTETYVTARREWNDQRLYFTVKTR